MVEDVGYLWDSYTYHLTGGLVTDNKITIDLIACILIFRWYSIRQSQFLVYRAVIY